MTKQEAIESLLVRIAETYYGDNTLRQNPEIQELINVIKGESSQKQT